MLKPWPATAPAPSHEDLFIQRYDWLMGWALRLTHNDRGLAEDLVHDTFVQFSLYRPELAAIRDLEAYLYTTLRNLHLAQVRWSATTQGRTLSIAEYDSAEIGLRETDAENKQRTHDALRQICHYAIARKESSKAGSVLILRFFHGYYPSEIAQVLRSPCRTVDNWLWIARREAKLFLTDPQRLKFIAEMPAMSAPHEHGDQPAEELLEKLRDRIFEARSGACPTAKELQDLYRPDREDAILSRKLAHLVSCRLCLDEVNKLLDLPTLADRYPPDRLGPDGRSGGGGAVETKSGAKLRAVRHNGRKRLQDVLEHKPSELRITVNGSLLGLLSVSSELSKLTMRVNTDERLGFVEVRSEQGLRLLLLNVEPPPEGVAEQTAHVELSEGRVLDLRLLFEDSAPTLDVEYHDPTFVSDELRAKSLESEFEAAQSTTDVQSTKHDSAAPVKAGSLWTLVRRRLADVRHRALDFGLLFRPGLITALFAALLLISLVLMWRSRPSQPLKAADLLQGALTAEQAIAGSPETVTHRTLLIEERRASLDGEVLARQRVEVWQSAARGLTTRRLYDDRGRLIAGEWTRSDNVTTLYHHGAKPQVRPSGAVQPRITLENVWQLSPSAKDFMALAGRVENARVEERANHYVVSFERQGLGAGGQGLVKTTLILSRDDLHAVEQTLLVQQETETRAYRISETSFERRPNNAVAPAVFEPDPELISANETEIRNPKLKSASAVVVPSSPVLATAALEVEVLQLLNSAGAFMGEQLKVTRTAEGRLHVDGIVDTEQRKNEILQALTPVRNNPAVRIDVATAAEAAGRQARQSPNSGQVSVSSVDVDVKTGIPADADLRSYLSAQKGLSGEPLNEEIRRFSERALGHSRQARRHASALKQIVERFSAEDLRTLDEPARRQWLSLVAQHARALEQECGALRRELQPIFFPNAGSGEREATAQIAGDADLVRAVARLFELALSIDDTVRRSFTVSGNGQQSVAVKASQFQQTLREAQSLAGKVSKQ